MDDIGLELILKFIPSFSCYLLSTCYVSCTVLGTGNKQVIDTPPAFFREFTVQFTKTCKQMRMIKFTCFDKDLQTMRSHKSAARYIPELRRFLIEQVKRELVLDEQLGQTWEQRKGIPDLEFSIRRSIIHCGWIQMDFSIMRGK